MFKKKFLTPFAALLLAIVCCSVSVFGTYMVIEKNIPKTESVGLYQKAITDAVVADKDEILPLVEIDKDSDMVTWNETGDKVLMLTFHKYPDSYPEGSEMKIQWGYVWIFSEKEFLSWYKDNENGVTNWSLRLKQLLGMPEDNKNTHVTAVWVSPDSLIRPAYITDVTQQMSNAFPADADKSDDYIQWFNDNAVYSYCDNTYPWTRLGYTYDWADNGKEYDLSEFLIQNGTDVTVEFTNTVGEFIESVEKDFK